MRTLYRLLIVVFGLYFGIVSAAQSPLKQAPEQAQGPFWTVLVDPVCPVTHFPGQTHESSNATRELRVMYFPTAKDAKLKDSKSLSLQMAFDGPHFFNNLALVPFTRKADHWEALVPLEKSRPVYAMFSIKDDDTTAVDDNDGKYWDIVFCRPDGEKDSNSLMQQAESYSGETWPFGMHRKTDFGKAVSLLENAAKNSTIQNSMTFTKMWEYKAKRDGEKPATYDKLAAEIERYVDEHKDDVNAQYGAGTFVMMNDKKFPPSFVERTIAKLDANGKDPAFSFHEELALQRAQSESDPQKALAALDQVIAQYPNTQQLLTAYLARFQICIALKDVPCAETALAKSRERLQAEAVKGVPDFTSQGLYLQMAELYAQQNVKPDAALKLTDEAERSLQAMRQPGNDEFVSQFESQIAETRARIYVAMHKYELALAEAQKAMTQLGKSAQAHFILAQAYAGAGDKTKALEEYFNAALMPSNNDLEYRAELKSFYLAHFGDEKEFEAALHKQIADRFQAANYAPKLIEQTAPRFEFTTLKGEKFDSANLNEKIVVINFWSPG